MLLDEAYEHALSEYGKKGYEFCKGLMERSPITVPHPTDATKEVEITAFWYDFSEQREGGPIQIHVCVPYSTSHGVEPHLPPACVCNLVEWSDARDGVSGSRRYSSSCRRCLA